MNLVNVVFQKYLEAAYPNCGKDGRNLPPEQLREVKNAFYAAVWASIHEISEVASALPEDTACAVLSKISDECRKHANEVLTRMYKLN
jgi:hypothetical protein